MERIIITGLLLSIMFSVKAQPANWQNMDLEKDSIFGVSTEKTYKELLAGKKPAKVIVAIIDTGIDTAHEDLKPVLWSSPENGRHGRSFMGYEKGMEDITRLAAEKKDFYDSLSYARVPEVYRTGYAASRKLVSDYNDHVSSLQAFMLKLENSKKILEKIFKKIGKDNPGAQDFRQYTPSDEEERLLVDLIKKHLPEYPDFATLRYKELDNLIDLGNYHLTHGLNLNDSGEGVEKIKNNDLFDVSNSALGLVLAPNTTPIHGTHVAGILGAVRNNGKGINGVADHVAVMMIKVLTNIRELRDEDLANGIRFAVDNGARIINLSFGKPYTWNKKAVDEAIQYAMESDVLILHAAGNSNESLDEVPHYPNSGYLNNKGKAKAWIEVAASGPKDDNTLAASFSSYGKKSVDVFAPGVSISSTIPGDKYDSWSGTSMATPVVAGIAALIREYYPKLTAIQVKDIIMESVVKRDVLKDKCVSGGVVNAYNALKLAATYK